MSNSIAKRKQELVEMLDLAQDAILVRDISGAITFWNAGCAETYGWDAQDAMGRDIGDLLQTKLPQSSETAKDELLANGHWTGEVTRTRKDGAEIVVAVRWALRRGAKGEGLEVFETGRDITEWVGTLNNLSKLQAALAHATRISTLGEMSASIAHEVNQPLTAIVTNGEASLRWLNRAEPDLGEAKTAITRMIEDGKRASDIILRIRALSAKHAPERVTVDCNELIQEVAAILAHQLGALDVAVRFELDNALPAIKADKIQLQQVLINLMVNGCQAMVQGGSKRRELVLRSMHTDNDVAIAVEDNGPGIDPALIPKLFSAFFTTKPEGLGMGLSICKSIIEAHNGRIWPDAAPGGGAIFNIKLPVADPTT